MITYLKGKIKYKGDKFIILEVNSIGYQVFLTPSFLEKIKENEEIEIFTFLYLKEETQELYGFSNLEELEFFKLLNSLKNVGPKIALGISSQGNLEEIKKAISESDLDFLTQVPGVGKKTAQRIIFELKGKFEIKIIKKEEDKEVIEALAKLGYSKKEINTALKELPEEIKETEEKIKKILKILGKQ